MLATDPLLVQSKWLHRKCAGRKWVAVSLAEAETIRRVMHLRHDRKLLDNHNVELALRFSPSAMPPTLILKTCAGRDPELCMWAILGTTTTTVRIW